MVNRLNDLSGKLWIKWNQSWFILNYKSRDKIVIEHPAKFPEELASRFIEFFTKKGEWVLDPFAGVGSTLIASKNLCDENGKAVPRNSVGIEINPKFIKIARDRLSQKTLINTGIHYMLEGNSLEIDTILNKIPNIPKFKLIFTSPPYWNILHTSRGGSNSTQKDRIEKKLPTIFSENPNDLGNIDDYITFIEKLSDIFQKVKPFLEKDAYIILILQNFITEDGTFIPMAWDVAYNLRKTYQLCQEQIWCQKDKKRGIWGFPTKYISNVHHQYAIILRNS